MLPKCFLLFIFNYHQCLCLINYGVWWKAQYIYIQIHTKMFDSVLGCFPQVDDINAAIVDLKAKNIRTLTAEPRIGAHGKLVMFLHPKDCDGVLVELEEAWIWLHLGFFQCPSVFFFLCNSVLLKIKVFGRLAFCKALSFDLSCLLLYL